MAGLYAHNEIPDTTQTYEPPVLVKNWYEDRFQGQATSTSGRAALRTLPTKERVIHQALPEGHPGLWTTTKAEFDTKMLSSPPVAKINKPSMYTEANLAERMNTYGISDTIHYTIGPNAAAEAAKPAERHMLTTNQELYGTKPAQAVASNPDLYRTGQSQFGKTGAMLKSVRGEASDQTVPVAGGKGSRGEITRRPGESGNPYGVQVYADEYSQWGDKIKGMPLTETVARMQTKYY